jgi:hypothetical protein
MITTLTEPEMKTLRFMRVITDENIELILRKDNNSISMGIDKEYFQVHREIRERMNILMKRLETELGGPCGIEKHPTEN